MPYSNISLSVFIFINTQVIKLNPLYRTLVDLSMYLSTQKANKHYPIYFEPTKNGVKSLIHYTF